MYVRTTLYGVDETSSMKKIPLHTHTDIDKTTNNIITPHRNEAVSIYHI